MEAGETDHQASESSSSGSFPAVGDGAVLHRQAYPVLGLGLAVGMSFLATALLPWGPPPPPKTFSSAIKLASDAFRGARALHSPGYSSFLFASETLVKGYKLLPSPAAGVVKAAKPCLGAATAVVYVHAPVQDLGFLGFGLLSYGYKVSKSFLRVLKGVSGFEMDVALKDGFDSLGFVLKLLGVAGELGQVGGRLLRRPRSGSVCGYRRDDDESRKLVVVDEEEGMAGVWVAQPQALCLSLPLAMDGCC